MKITRTLYVKDREEWRRWLQEHYASESEVWLIYPKAHTGTQRIPYDDAVEEALCFGWIDSNVQTIDDEKYAQKFTPRRTTSKWSALNRQRARRMIAEGKMTEAGFALLPDLSQPDEEANPARAFVALPADVEAALRANPPAWENYSRFTERYQQICLGWITHAKKEETRLKRIQEFVELTAKNQKIGMK
jgi:uncharacterized protein YdeI (YjbR/CyaY-like superfamily)